MKLLATIEKALRKPDFAAQLKQAADECTLPDDPTKPYDPVKWTKFIGLFSTTPSELAKLSTKESSDLVGRSTGGTTEIGRLLKAAVTSTTACALTTTTTTVIAVESPEVEKRKPVRRSR